MLDLDTIRTAAKQQARQIVAPVAHVALSHTIQTEIEAPTEAPASVLTPTVGITATSPTASTPRPIPWFHLDADWRKACAAWQAHRNACPQCRTSERTAATAGTGIRCAEGQRLHATYEAALDSSPT